MPKLEARMIEFLAEWLVSLLMPAQSVLEVRAPHLSFMFQKQYTASFGRSESYTRVVDGQVRCITPDTTSQSLQVIWNVQYITAFVSAWMVPPIYHSIQRETVKVTEQTGELGYRSVQPTWFEDDTSLHGQKPSPNQNPPQEMHGLKLIIKEEIMPQDELPCFPGLTHLAENGFLAPDAWNCKKLHVSLKVTTDVPMLGTIIENNGDSLDDSHMPVGWPLVIDGAVRQFCVHRYTTIQDMQDMLKAYDLGKTPWTGTHHNGPTSQCGIESTWKLYMATTYDSRAMDPSLFLLSQLSWTPLASQKRYFFPSFAFSALARSSHSVCASERIKHCITQHPALGSQKGAWTITQSESTQGCSRKNKANKDQNKNQPRTTKNQSPRSMDELRHGRQLVRP